MAAERVAGEESDIEGEDDGAQADAEMGAFGISHAIAVGGKPERLPYIPGQKKQKGQCEIEEIAVQVLKDQRQAILTPIAFPRLADGAGNRIGPEGFVVC